MDPWHLLTPVVQALMTSVMGHATGGSPTASRWPAFVGRAHRRMRHRDLETAAARARMDISAVAALINARRHPLAFELAFSGVRTSVAAMEHLRDDLIAVLELVLEIRDECPPAVSRSADDLVVALVGTMPGRTSQRPSWRWRHKTSHGIQGSTEEAYEDALRMFRLQAQADAAPQWGARRRAKRALRDGARAG